MSLCVTGTVNPFGGQPPHTNMAGPPNPFGVAPPPASGPPQASFQQSGFGQFGAAPVSTAAGFGQFGQVPQTSTGQFGGLPNGGPAPGGWGMPPQQQPQPGFGAPPPAGAGFGAPPGAAFGAGFGKAPPPQQPQGFGGWGAAQQPVANPFMVRLLLVYFLKFFMLKAVTRGHSHHRPSGEL